jgi:C4-dicarboxylate-specific signal transduction histidine kinase
LERLVLLSWSLQSVDQEKERAYEIAVQSLFVMLALWLFVRALKVRDARLQISGYVAYGCIMTWLLAFAATSTSAATRLPPAALIIDESDPSSGAPTNFSATLRETLIKSKPHVAVFGETIDLSRFAGSKQEAILRTYIEHKYSDVRFGIIVAVGPTAFDLVSRWRTELWPQLPVVFAAIDEITAAQLKLDFNTTGLIMRRTLKSMMSVARILVPDLRGVVLLGGSLEKDAYRRSYLHELPALAAETTLTNLTGLPQRVQEVRAAALPGKTAILYTSLFIDDEGTRYSARDALAAIASVANRPIVVDVESRIGLGATGGLVLDNVAYGKEVAALVLRILEGVSVAATPVAISEFTRPIFDWRQLERWKVGENRLPPSSEIRFRRSTAWQQYSIQIVTISAAFVLQAMLVAWLLYERRYRHRAEAVARDAASELVQMNRFAAAGELSASIAHEINQPLTGIVANASAARRWLSKERPDTDKIRTSLDQIERAADRAASVIKNLRTVFKRDTSDKSLININKIILTVLAIGKREIEKHQIKVEMELDHQLPSVNGNAVQVQQVVLNLVMNAMEAMHSVQPRILRIQSRRSKSNTVNVSIEDTGTGIKPSEKHLIFKALFTTKATGMGMGLSICHSIIETHNERIWASEGVDRGSIFQFELPIAMDKA